jgi:hypothetical protein
MNMRLFLGALGVFAVMSVAPAYGKSKEPVAPSAKEPAKDPKAGNIKDEEAVRCILERLEGQSGAKGWKVELKDAAGSAKEFVAMNGDRQEKGTVNVAKSYPNQGALRVYLVPRD